jgi:retron-type reverse transcriptase
MREHLCFKEWIQERGRSELQSIIEELKVNKKQVDGADGVKLSRYYSSKKTEMSKTKTFAELEIETILRHLLRKKDRLFSKVNITGGKLSKKIQKLKQTDNSSVKRKISSKNRPITRDCARTYLTQKLILKYLEGSFNQHSKNSYAYQKRKSARKAVQELLQQLKVKPQIDYVFEYDLKSFFDTIVHSVLLQKIENFFGNDLELKHAINAFCVSKEYQSKELYGLKKTKEDYINKHERYANTVTRNIGIFQGGVLSGFLANLMLHDLDMWAENNPDIIYTRYADDFLIFCDSSREDIKLAIKEKIQLYIDEHCLKISEEKSVNYNINKSFSYLGFTFKRQGDKYKVALNDMNFIKLCERFSIFKYQNKYWKVTNKCIDSVNKKYVMQYHPSVEAIEEAKRKNFTYFPKWIEVKEDNTIDILDEINKVLEPKEESNHNFCWYTYFSIVNDAQQIKALSTILKNSCTKFQSKFSEVQVLNKNKDFSELFFKKRNAGSNKKKHGFPLPKGEGASIQPLDKARHICHNTKRGSPQVVET